MDIATANGALLSLSENMNGPFGGLHAGGNWQTGNGVFGIEADIQGISHSVSSTATVVDFAGSIVPAGAIVTASNADKVSSFGTIRGRIGVATGRWLFYGTGGWSYWTWRSNLTVQGLGSVSLSEFQGGGAIGGGVELAVAPNWTARAEYLYLQSTNFSERPFLARPDVVVNSRIRDNTFRVGVSYMFFTGSVGCRPHVC
jgi:outer membrane immunogenic protein